MIYVPSGNQTSNVAGTSPNEMEVEFAGTIIELNGGFLLAGFD